MSAVALRCDADAEGKAHLRERFAEAFPREGGR